MLGRDDVVHGVEGTSDSDVQSIHHKKADADGVPTAPLT